MFAPAAWLEAAQEYSTRHFNQPRPDTGPFMSLSVNKLREWAMQRCAIDKTWDAPQAQRKSHILPVKHAYKILSLTMIPGGRWLLVGGFHGTIDYYDLSRQLLEPRTLIPSGDPGDSISTNIHVEQALVYVDRQYESLEFTLAYYGVEG